MRGVGWPRTHRTPDLHLSNVFVCGDDRRHYREDEPSGGHDIPRSRISLTPSLVVWRTEADSGWFRPYAGKQIICLANLGYILYFTG